MRKVIVRGALMLVPAIAVVAALDLLVPGAGDRLRSADPAWLAVGVALEAGALAAYVAFFHAVFDQEPERLPLRRSTAIALGELAGFALVPTGAGGPAVRFVGLRASGMTWRVIGERSVLYAVIFNVPYIGAALVLGIAVMAGIGPGEASTLVALSPLGVVAGTIALCLLAAALVRSRWMTGAASWQRSARAMLAVVPAGVRAIPGFVRRPGRTWGAFGFWALDCAVLWATCRACGGTVAAGVVVLAYMLGQLGNALPLPGGVGGVEPLMVGIFVASGVDSALAAAAVVCYRAIALGMQSVTGVAALAALAPALRRIPSTDRGHRDHLRHPPAAR